MVMKEKIKNITVSWVVLSVLYILLGISLAVWPAFVMSVICYVFGAILLLYGVFSICGFYRGKEHKAVALLALFLGIVSAALGAMMIIFPDKVQSVIFVILGLYVVIDAVLNIRRVWSMRWMAYPRWKIHLILAVAAALLGIFIAGYPLYTETVVFRSIGLILIFVGGSDLWTLIQLSYLTHMRSEFPGEHGDIVDG
ncbi:MAG: DUF308 domain-containing protein [Acutalibacteraceae bacterium]